MGSKVDEVGPKRKTANLAPFFSRAWLWLSCRATGESVLEVHLDDLSLRRACRGTGESALE